MLPQRCDFQPGTLGNCQKPAISFRRLGDDFAARRFYAGDFRKLSQACGFVPETSGRFRSAAIACGNRRETFASLRFQFSFTGLRMFNIKNDENF
jgi:hypothetical protein